MTNRERTEEALRESEARFRFLFEKTPLPMWLFDPNTLQFLEVNEAALSSYGHSRDEFLSMLVTEIGAAEEEAAWPNGLTLLLSAPGQTGEWKHRTRTGRVIDVEVTCYPLALHGGPAALLIAQETERKRARDRELLLKLSHDVRTALNGIIGMTGLALETALTSEQRDYLMEVKACADTLLEAVRNM